MSRVYLIEPGSKLCINGGRMNVIKDEKIIESIPKNLVKSVNIFGNSSITTPCMDYLLEKRIPTVFMTKSGKYIGRLDSGFDEHRIDLLKNQVLMFENKDIALEYGKEIINSKINNQRVVLKRHLNNSTEIDQLKYYLKHIDKVSSIAELMGYEGNCARIYFSGLSKIVPEEFDFKGRERGYYVDPFNALLNLGYTMISNEIRSDLESVGLNPYLSIIHKESNRYAGLSYDLVEEWRSIIAESVALTLVLKKEISIKDFESNGKRYFLSSEGMKKYMNRYENKMESYTSYLTNNEYTYTIRRLVHEQCNLLKESVRLGNYDLYKGVKIR